MLDLLADLLLASDANKFEILIKESLRIRRDGPVLNRTINHYLKIYLTRYLVLTVHKKCAQFSIFNRKRKMIME